MRKIFFALLFFFSLTSFSQTDSAKWLRAFPITSYIVDANDSIKIVQVQMPDGLSLNSGQLGLVYGLYNGSKEDAVQKGYGKCNLIKGNYYYFTIGHNESGLALKEGDLLYTFMEKTEIYFGQIPKLAAHSIELETVYEVSMYDRNSVFYQWTMKDETALIDSMVSDIQFTGKYFIENNPEMDVAIKTGDFAGKKTLYVMAECKPEYVKKFLDYVIARPRLYAGKKWKVSEIFATWLSEGAPAVIKN